MQTRQFQFKKVIYQSLKYENARIEEAYKPTLNLNTMIIVVAKLHVFR